MVAVSPSTRIHSSLSAYLTSAGNFNSAMRFAPCKIRNSQKQKKRSNCLRSVSEHHFQRIPQQILEPESFIIRLAKTVTCPFGGLLNKHSLCCVYELHPL